MSSATANGATVDNFGSIVNLGGATGGGNAGIVLSNGGTVTNHAGATINSQSDGIFTVTAGTTVTNDGAIATNVTGVYFGNGGTFTQSATGSIHDNGGSATYGVIANAGTLTGTNAGSIEAVTIGVWYRGGTGTFSNTGSVTGNVGVRLDSSGTNFVNNGTITGTGGNAIVINGGTNTLTLSTGSVINGKVVVNGPSNTLALQGTGTENKDLTGFSKLLMGGSNWQLGGTVTTNGGGTAATEIANGRLIITGTLSDSSGGGTTIDAPGTLQIGNGGNSGSIVGPVVDNGTLAFNRSDTVAYTYVISGNGAVRQMGPGTLTLTGANTYLGGTTVTGGALAVDPTSATSTTNLGSGTVAIASGATLAANTNSAFSFANALTGTGLLSASNSGGAFSFTSNAGSAFAGTVALSNNTFALGGTNTTALTHATLSVGAGNITTVANGNQHIGGLVLNGGTVVFNGTAPAQSVATSLITANTLDVSGTGLVRINNVPAPYVVPTPTPAGDLSLFAQSHVNDGLQLVAAGSVTGSAGGLTLQDQNGNAIAGAQNVNIQQGGNPVAVGHYNYILGTGAQHNGLYVGYGLSQLDLLAGRTLTLTESAGATGNDADLAAKLTGAGNLDVAANNAVTLSNPTNDFTGTTTVSKGTLRAGATNALSPNSAVTVASGATLDLNGYSQTTAGLINAGLVTFGKGTAPGTALTVKGDYVGNNGQVVLNTVLVNDSSATDKLVIDGGRASGRTALVIKHAGGNGAQTNQGIRVVETVNGGTTDATAFSLSTASDGYRAGVGTIAMGAYDYRLKRGGNGGVANDWYLSSLGNDCTTNASLCPADPQSQPQPQQSLRPEVGAYLNNRLFAQTMQFHTLRERQSQAPGMVGKDLNASSDANAWVRVVGKTSSREGALSASDTSYMVHAGGDVLRFSVGGEGSLRIGAMGAYGSSSNRADNGSLTARGTVDGYSAGVYGTWYGHKDILSGPYVDSWIMYGTFNNKVNGQGLPTESYNSRNLAASLEAGYSFQIHEDGKTRMFVEPQAQVIVSDYHAGSHTERNGTVVSGQSGTAVTTRLGARLHGDVLDDAGMTQMRPFAEVNWWHGPGSQSATFDGVTVRDGLPANRLEGKVGMQGNVTKAVSVWGSVGFEVGANDYAAGKAQIGAKYSW